MRINIWRNALVIISFSVYSSCQKTITVKPPTYQSKLSIQGTVEIDSLPIVYINRTVPYFNANVNFTDLVVKDAMVSISSPGNSIDVLHLDSVYDRIYCEYNYFYKGSKTILSNTEYDLVIQAGPDTYTASASTAKISGASIDNTAYLANYKDLYGEHEGVVVNFKDVLDQANYYRYEMDRYIDTATKKAEVRIVSSCLGKDSILVQELGRSVYSDFGQDGRELQIIIEPAYSHQPGTKGYIRIQSIDKNAFDFFDQLDKQKIAQYNPFVEPVFLKDGQFGSRAIGYFSAITRSKPVIYRFPE